MDGAGGFVFFFGTQMLTVVLDILTYHNERSKNELGDVGDK